jgi:hypothetical protein
MRPMFLAVDRKIPLVPPAKTKFEPGTRSLWYSTRSCLPPHARTCAP